MEILDRLGCVSPYALNDSKFRGSMSHQPPTVANSDRLHTSIWTRAFRRWCHLSGTSSICRTYVPSCYGMARDHETWFRLHERTRSCLDHHTLDQCSHKAIKLDVLAGGGRGYDHEACGINLFGCGCFVPVEDQQSIGCERMSSVSPSSFFVVIVCSVVAMVVDVRCVCWLFKYCCFG